MDSAIFFSSSSLKGSAQCNSGFHSILPLTRFLNKRLKQSVRWRIVLKSSFWMPLYSNHKVPRVCTLKSFYHTVFRAPGHHAEAITNTLRSLMVARIHWNPSRDCSEET